MITVLMTLLYVCTRVIKSLRLFPTRFLLFFYVSITVRLYLYLSIRLSLSLSA